MAVQVIFKTLLRLYYVFEKYSKDVLYFKEKCVLSLDV